MFDAGLPAKDVTKGQLGLVRRMWQMPMYNLDFAKLSVPLDDLKRQQEARQP